MMLLEISQREPRRISYYHRDGIQIITCMFEKRYGWIRHDWVAVGNFLWATVKLVKGYELYMQLLFKKKWSMTVDL